MSVLFCEQPCEHPFCSVFREKARLSADIARAESKGELADLVRAEWQRAERAEAESDLLRAALMDVRAEAERLIQVAAEELNSDIDRDDLEDYELPGFDVEMAYYEGIESAAVNLRDRAKAAGL